MCSMACHTFNLLISTLLFLNVYVGAGSDVAALIVVGAILYLLGLIENLIVYVVWLRKKTKQQGNACINNIIHLACYLVRESSMNIFFRFNLYASLLNEYL